MFKRILVPVDGSTTSMQAVDKAIVMAKAFAAPVTVVCVIDPYPFTGIGEDFGYGQSEYLSAAMGEAHRSIHNAEAAFKAAGIDTEARIVESRVPHEGILETATEQGADLIIMGSHGRRGLQRFLLGSVAQRVLSHADVPVMVVRG
jgi:nucleotide-binding universal stress UspA family protein